ncbi:conserved hypothetical protein, membrane [sediment metagenome]|uniref:DUF4010 domain-containing protein n=1 Tax=sediment metagenome TaxID=749907 RepID=D9PHB4_9ZZZZ
MVVFITSIGFIGHFLTKYFRNAKIEGIYLISFFGSLVSSTAVTVQLSERLKKEKDILNYFIPAILLSISVMLIRTMAIILFIVRDIKYELFLAPLLMFLVSIFFFLFYYSKHKKEKIKINIDLGEKSPFEILPALKFASIFVVILFIVFFMDKYFGDKGIYLTSFIVSIIDSEAIIFSILESFKNGIFDISLVSNLVSLIVVVNTFIKLLYIWLFAGKKYFLNIFTIILLVVFGGILGFFLV